MDFFARKDGFIFSKSEMSFEELLQLPGATQVSRNEKEKERKEYARLTFSENKMSNSVIGPL